MQAALAMPAEWVDHLGSNVGSVHSNWRDDRVIDGLLVTGTGLTEESYTGPTMLWLHSWASDPTTLVVLGADDTVKVRLDASSPQDSFRMYDAAPDDVFVFVARQASRTWVSLTPESRLPVLGPESDWLSPWDESRWPWHHYADDGVVGLNKALARIDATAGSRVELDPGAPGCVQSNECIGDGPGPGYGGLWVFDQDGRGVVEPGALGSTTPTLRFTAEPGQVVVLTRGWVQPERITLAPAAPTPSAPSSVTATPGAGSASITWKQPADAGASPVTGYTATAAPGGASCSTTGALTCTIGGLRGNTQHTVTVIAHNAAGSSHPSRSVMVIPGLGPPGAPQLVTARVTRAADGAVTVEWQAPAFDGGAPISGYHVAVGPTGTHVDPSTRSTSLGVPPGVHQVSVRAYNLSPGGEMHDGPPGVSSVTVPSPQAIPPAPARRASVTVTSIDRRSRLHVNVNPNKGSGYWTFQVQRQRADGSWKALKTYRTAGPKETRTLNLPKGTYRVVVHPKYQRLGTTSKAVRLSR